MSNTMMQHITHNKRGSSGSFVVRFQTAPKVSKAFCYPEPQQMDKALQQAQAWRDEQEKTRGNIKDIRVLKDEILITINKLDKLIYQREKELKQLIIKRREAKQLHKRLTEIPEIKKIFIDKRVAS